MKEFMFITSLILIFGLLIACRDYVIRRIKE